MQIPKVSFVVPCYKLGHLLAECIHSILSQTFVDFEILIMDDCSPDNTAAIANSFADPRVKHIRNPVNIGHLCNYNKGIKLSHGKYVWLISADDYLRKPYVLQKYVDLMDKHPNIGYCFCSATSQKNGREEYVVGQYDKSDQIVSGHLLLKTLLDGNMVIAASAMARRECYEKISFFPLDAVWAGAKVNMGWAGDWYLWCLFALYYDVGCFAEPMVCYREHDLAISKSITQPDNVRSCATADIAVLWMIKQKANEAGFESVSRDCLRAVAQEYARHAISKQYRSGHSRFSRRQFELSICASTESEQERNLIRARVLEAIADKCCIRGDISSARKLYLAGLRMNPRRLRMHIKLLLILFGKTGRHFRRGVRTFRTKELIITR